jgi:hypothetical protein
VTTTHAVMGTLLAYCPEGLSHGNKFGVGPVGIEPTIEELCGGRDPSERTGAVNV